jgi:hypothetical protein
VWWNIGGGFNLSSSKRQTPSATKTIGTKTIGANVIGALSEEALDKAVSYAASQDREAFNQQLASGQIFLVKEGLSVHIEKCLGFACSKVKVRPHGQTTEFYVIREALK